MRHPIARRLLSSVALCALIVTPSVVSPPAEASAASASCISMVKQYWNSTFDSGPNGRALAFTLVSNQSALNGVVSYTEGSLNRTPDGGFKSFRPGGHARAYFSDRRDDEHPFDPENTDDVELIIKSTGDLELRLKDWGDARSEIKNPTCERDLIYGWGPNRGGGAGQALYVLSISDRLPETGG